MTSVILLAAFLCGAYAIIAQTCLARESLVVFLGNEMTLATLLAGWLAGVAAGARMARAKVFAEVRPAYALVMCLAAWVVIVPVTVLAVRMSRGILAIPIGVVAPFWTLPVVSAFFVAPIAALAGFAFVTLARLAAAAGAFANPVGLVYIAEAAGGAAGGFAFTFFLAGRFAPFTIALAAYVVLGVLCIVFSVLAAKRGLLQVRTATSFVIGMAILAASGAALLAAGRDKVLDINSAVARMQTIGQGYVIDERETPYQNLTTVLLAGQYTMYGNGEPLFTFPQPLLDEREACAILTEHGNPKSVLVIGGGPSFLRAVLAFGVESIDYIELDPAVISVCRPLLNAEERAALDSSRVSVHFGDARAFVARGSVARAALSSPSYDCIIVRTPDPKTLLLNRLFTRDFFLAAGGCLRPGGVISLPVTLADGYLSGDVGAYGGGVYRTLRDVFPDVLATPEVSSLFLASRDAGVLTSSVAELSRRFESRGLHSELFPQFFAYMFPAGETASANAALAAIRAPINSDWRPTTYVANLAIWARLADSTVARWLFAAATRASWAVYGAAIALALAGAFAVVARPSVPRAAGVAVFYTGVSAMSMTVLLLYCFQVKCGYVYTWMGALSAAVIAGIVAGGLIGHASHRAKSFLVLAEGLNCLLPLVAIFVLAVPAGNLAADDVRWLILALAAVAGLAAGLEFPLAASVLVSQGVSAGDAASRLEIRDQAGACIGAVLAGIILVPAVGIWWSLMFLVGVKLFSMIAVWSVFRRRAVAASS